MTIATLPGSRPWLAAGWTMLHFLWVGGTLGLVAAAGRRTLRAARPEVRYGFALSCLAALALAPAAIVLLLIAADEPGPIRAVPPTRMPPAAFPSPVGGPAPMPPVALPDSGIARDRSKPIRPSGGRPWERLMSAAVVGLPWLWLCGAPATFALLATGLVGAERLRRQGRPLLDGELPGLARRLAASLGIARPVALAVHDRLIAPVLLGVVRPVILLPPAVLTGWSVEQVEMALLHELAHVRRLDNLVNLGQRLVESVLFFHPVVWWVSGWVRLEREHCCDRLVVARTGRARPYAELLAALATTGSRPGRVVVAMAESPVVARIRRILNLEDYPMRLARPVVALAAAPLIAPAVLVASLAAVVPGQEEAPRSQPAAPPAPAKPDLAKLDELLRRARHGADMFEDVQGRAFALTRIAAAEARHDDRDAARRTFREAVTLGEAVRFDDSYYTPHILLRIAQSQAEHDFRDDSAETLRKLVQLAETPVDRDSSKFGLYKNILKLQVELGDRDGARETLRLARRFYRTSKEPIISTFASVELVGLQATSGDLAGALRMLDDPELFRGLNPRDAAIRRHDAAISIVQAIGPSNREGADAVLKEVRRVADSDWHDLPWIRQVMRNQDLEAIARAQGWLGRFDEARRTAEAIDAESTPEPLAESAKGRHLDEQRNRKANAFATLSEAQLEAGDRDGARQSARDALQVVSAIQAEEHKGYPQERAIKVLAQAGEAAEALRIAETLNPARRAATCEIIADAQRLAGDEAGARQTLQAALKLIQGEVTAARPVDPDPSREEVRKHNQLLGQAAHLQALLGDLDGALKTASTINWSDQQSEAMKRLAVDRVAANDLDGALEVVGQINGPKSEAEALKELVSAIGRRKPAPGRPAK